VRRLLAVAALLLAASTAVADVDARAQLGFAGRWVVDAATPLTLDLSNSGAEPVTVEIIVSQGSGVMASDIVHRRVVQIGAGAVREELFVVPGAQLWSGGVSIELNVDPVVGLHSPTKNADRGSLTFDVVGAGGGFSGGQIAYATRVLGVVGDARGSLAARMTALGLSTDDEHDRRASHRIEAVEVPPEVLRLAPLGLDGLDALILCDPDAQAGADPVAKDALLDWVALGGTLAVSLGEHSGQFSASPMAAEMPATWTGAGRTSYAQLLGDLGTPETEADLPGPWTVLTPRAGVKSDPAFDHDGAPTALVRRLGLGRIVLLPFDVRYVLAASWLKEQDARTILAPFLAAAGPSKEKDGESWDRIDYASPIARTLQAGAFEPPPLVLIVLGIVLYVIVVGPIDWIVLKRLKKERLTTLTFLGAVVAFTLLAYGASLLLFSSGARVNRIVLADLVDAGRDGRQLLRFVDIAGYYSPTGSDQDVTYSSAAVVLPAALPGAGMGGDIGSSLPVQVITSDPLRPKAVVQLAFRSQRAIRVVSSGTLGPTIDVEWDKGGVRVVNGLPVDLDDVAVYTSDSNAYSLGPVASGATSNGGTFLDVHANRDREFERIVQRGWGGSQDEPVNVRHLLETMTVGPYNSARDLRMQGDDALTSLRKSGIDRSAAFGRRHALLIAHASKFPVALPGSQVEGTTHVVFRKEVEIP
jgi:hypothetical protein